MDELELSIILLSANVQATDGDASPPNNVLKYELSESGSSERSTNYFKIDEETGDISIKDDLTQELYEEYRVSYIILLLRLRSTN